MIDILYESFVNDTAMELFGLSKKEKESKAAKQAQIAKEEAEYRKKYELAEKFMKDKSKMNPIIKKLLAQAVSRFDTVAEDIYGGKTPAGKAPKAKDFQSPEIEIEDYSSDPKIEIRFRLTHEYCKFLYNLDPDKADSVEQVEEFAWIYFDYNPFTDKVDNICQYDS